MQKLCIKVPTDKELKRNQPITGEVWFQAKIFGCIDFIFISMNFTRIQSSIFNSRTPKSSSFWRKNWYMMNDLEWRKFGIDLWCTFLNKPQNNRNSWNKKSFFFQMYLALKRKMTSSERKIGTNYCMSIHNYFEDFMGAAIINANCLWQDACIIGTKSYFCFFLFEICYLFFDPYAHGNTII